MNHKKWMAVIALAVTALILTHLPVSEADAAASASDFQTQGSTLVKYRGTEERVTIPDTVEVVGESAFENNQKVQFVVIPKSVKRLDAYVFWGCNNLEEVVLGKGLTAVDEYSFAGCTGLKQITIPENVQSIDAQAFAGCINLTDIYIPATVTGIAEDAFLNCDNVTIHADEGSVAAQFSQKLAEQKNRDPLVTAAPVQTPTAVSRPDTQATTEPVSTTTPAPVATPVPGNVLGSTIVVGNHALVMVHPGEEKVQQGYTEPEAGQETGEEQDITAETENGKIPEWMYYRNQSVSAVTIPEGTTEIGRFAFSRSSLRTVTIPEGVTVIDYAAFYHCDNLDNVILPDTVNTVGAKAFTHTGWMDDFEENSMDDFLISGDILVAYKGNLPEVVIPDGVRVIAEEAFRNHTELKKVHLPASVTDIGNDAFPEGIEIINE
ncbi:leucine-rich repeat protein [Simiaoa sunii]|jgi:biotin carboxyl carrier protein|uniref:Leucine-rich repeat protein n=1 Tax=Simiaoa sunii TaxID=2763672 RepID=A0A7G9FZD3_9FIRM|nr:leucine-rich repeat protein [Simiaoa sunii]QNM03915.1 leucine-rich repeat protein [Simiaoa sunii]